MKAETAKQITLAIKGSPYSLDSYPNQSYIKSADLIMHFIMKSCLEGENELNLEESMDPGPLNMSVQLAETVKYLVANGYEVSCQTVKAVPHKFFQYKLTIKW